MPTIQPFTLCATPKMNRLSLMKILEGSALAFILVLTGLLAGCGGSDGGKGGDSSFPLNLSADLSAGTVLLQPTRVNVLIDDPERAATVEYSVNGRPLSPRRQGALSVKLDPHLLPDGTHELGVSVTDNSGYTEHGGAAHPGRNSQTGDAPAHIDLVRGLISRRRVPPASARASCSASAPGLRGSPA